MDALNLTSAEARVRIKRNLNKRLRQVQSSVKLSVTRRTTISGVTASGENQMTISGANLMTIFDPVVLKRPLGEVTLEELRQMDAATEVVGAPYLFAEYLHGASTITVQLYPEPTDENVLMFDILDNATDMVEDDDEPAFPADFHDILVEGAKYYEYQKMEKMLPLAQEAEKFFQRRLSELRYFLSKKAWLKIRATDRYAEFGLSARIWPYANLGA
jgi:hypothetical protein